MKTALIVFFSYVAMLGTKNNVLADLPGMNQGQGQSQGQNPSVIYPNPVIPLPKFPGIGNFQLGGGGGGAGQPQFMMPQFSEEQKKCLTSFANKGMQSCTQDLANSFATQKISIKPDCCSALSGMKDACKSVVHFQNPIFEAVVKRHCDSGGSMPGGGADDASGAGSVNDASDSGSSIAGGARGSMGGAAVGSAGASGSADSTDSVGGAGATDNAAGARSAGGTGPTDPSALGGAGDTAGSGPTDPNTPGAGSAGGSGLADPNASGGAGPTDSNTSAGGSAGAATGASTGSTGPPSDDD